MRWAAAYSSLQFCLQQRAALLCPLERWVCEENAASWQLCRSPQLVAPKGKKINEKPIDIGGDKLGTAYLKQQPCSWASRNTSETAKEGFHQHRRAI